MVNLMFLMMEHFLKGYFGYFHYFSALFFPTFRQAFASPEKDCLLSGIVCTILFDFTDYVLEFKTLSLLLFIYAVSFNFLFIHSSLDNMDHSI